MFFSLLQKRLWVFDLIRVIIVSCDKFLVDEERRIVNILRIWYKIKGHRNPLLDPKTSCANTRTLPKHHVPILEHSQNIMFQYSNTPFMIEQSKLI